MSSHMVVHTSFHLCSAWQAGRPSPERTGFKMVSPKWQRPGRRRPCTSRNDEGRHRVSCIRMLSPVGDLPARSGNQRCDRSLGPAECDSVPFSSLSVSSFPHSAGRSHVSSIVLFAHLSFVYPQLGRQEGGAGTHRIQNDFLKMECQATETAHSRNTSGKAQNELIQAVSPVGDLRLTPGVRGVTGLLALRNVIYSVPTPFRPCTSPQLGRPLPCLPVMIVHTSFHLSSAWQAGRPDPGTHRIQNGFLKMGSQATEACTSRNG